MKKKTRTPKRRSAKKKHLGRYASSIEKYCADQLKEYGLAFDYEEHQFELMDKFRFPNKYFKMTAKGKDMADRTGPSSSLSHTSLTLWGKTTSGS